MNPKIHNNENRVALKSGFWYTISNFFTRAIVLITTPIFSRILTTDEFGDFHVYANWQSLFLIICSMEFSLTINRARLDYNDRQLKNYIGNCLIANWITTLIIFILVICNDWIRKDFLMLENNYIYVMFIYLLCYPAFEMFQTEQRVKYRYKLSAVLSFVSVFFGACLAVFGTLVFEDKLLGRIVGQYFPVIIFGMFFASIYLLSTREISLKYCRYGMCMAVPLIFSYLGSQILTSSDKIVVQHIESAEAVGYIGIVTTCSHIMTILIQCLNNAWAPWFYDRLELRDYGHIKKAFRLYGLFVSICTFGVILIGPELVKVLGGVKYMKAIYLVPPSIAFCIFNFFIFQYINIEIYYKKTRFSAVATGGIAALNIGLDIVFVNIFGYIAASFVTVFCYSILMFLHAWYVNKIDEHKFITYMNLLLILIFVSLMILISYFSYEYKGIRYLCIFFLMLFSGWIFATNINIKEIVKGKKNEQ